MFAGEDVVVEKANKCHGDEIDILYSPYIYIIYIYIYTYNIHIIYVIYIYIYIYIVYIQYKAYCMFWHKLLENSQSLHRSHA